MDAANVENLPIFIRIVNGVKDHILMGEVKEGEKLPSTPQLAKTYEINIATVNRAYNILVDEGIVFKKRGIGMFVSKGAVDRLIEERRSSFKENYIAAALKEAKLLRYSVEDLQKIVAEVFEQQNLQNE
ncbi:MAG: GntR family transcriptional regulator [Ruminococcus sp.]|nr:GntR family transcriptional regulator [Ruminococcus sp.]